MHPRRAVSVLRALRRAAVVVVVALLGTGLLAARADAHAELLSTTPADGALLDDAPSEVVLRFSEGVGFADDTLRVFDSDGARVDVGTPESDGASVRIGLRDDLPDGSYVASWRVVSADGHPISGAFVFSVGVDEGLDRARVEEIAGSASDDSWDIVAGMLRFLVLVGVLPALGVAVATVVGPWAVGRSVGGGAPARRLDLLVRVGAVVGALGAVAGLPVEAALVTGRGVDALTDGAALSDVLGTTYGDAVAWRVAGCLLLVAATFGAGRVRAGLVGVGGAALLVAAVTTGHAATTDPRAVVVTSHMAHYATAAVWTGGLVALLLTVRAHRAADDAPAAGRAVACFSAVAAASVAVLTVAGVTRAWTETRSIDALTDTRYGRLVLVKAGLAVVIVAIGAYNRQRLLPAIRARGSERAFARLGRTMRAELAVVGMVLAVTAVLVATVPGRESVDGPQVVSVSTPFADGVTLDVTVEPAQAGLNEIHVYTLDPTGRPVEPGGEPTLELSLPAADIGPITRIPLRAGPGHWTMSGNELAVAGDWQIEVVVRVDEFTEHRAAVTIPVR